MSEIKLSQNTKTSDETVVVKERVKVLIPKYKVIMHNDDKTPFDFVTQVLCEIFAYKPGDAEALAKKIHIKGQAVAGLYTYEVAEAKMETSVSAARHYGFPLRVTIEKE